LRLPDGRRPQHRQGRRSAESATDQEASMSTQDVHGLLAQHRFTRDFQPPQIARLAALARSADFAAQQVIFREGEENSEFHLIVRGRVAIEMVVGNRTLCIQTLNGGDEFGVSALIMDRSSRFQVRALQRVETLAFDGAKVIQACREDPAFGFHLMRKLLLIVSERLDATRLQLMDTYSPVAARAGA
jgi:CRP-like cAMP-binding protein